MPPLTDRTGTPIEQPQPYPGGNALFGSDVVAETLRALELPFIALNPGASFRGLHDSLVNYLGNRAPQMLLCLHEEHAVAIAHGYAKVTGKPMAVALHSNVGLMHATMAMFNAWCDRVPMLVLGATGPMDAPKRRPWIDWIHTARDQGALVRPYTKWDDQPASAEAARESLLRGMWLATAPPCGPVYVNLDAGMQEAALAEPLPPLDSRRFLPAMPPTPPDAAQVAAAAALMGAARRPVILFGRGSRDPAHWRNRVALAEALGAHVVTDLKCASVFPTDHPLHAGAPATFPDKDAGVALAAADLVLSFDWVDFAGTLRAACGTNLPDKIIAVSLDHHVHNGWSMDHQAHPPADLFLAADPDLTVAALLTQLAPGEPLAERNAVPEIPPQAAAIHPPELIQALRRALEGRRPALLHTSLSWNAALWPFRDPFDYIGGDGGAGIGAGPGIAVGAALALRGSGRFPVAVCGDGDTLMGITALWTAVHYNISLLLVVSNNRSFFNDEMHQERVARMRNRPVENRWIGQRMSDPEIDIAAMASAQGALGIGPIDDAAALPDAFARAARAVADGGVCVVDVRVAVD